MSQYITEPRLQLTLHDVSKTIKESNEANGWYDKPIDAGAYVALIHSECSELLEALRHDGMESDHLPGITAAAEELADIVIRVLDFAYRFGYDQELSTAIIEKLQYNTTRGYRHGNKSF